MLFHQLEQALLTRKKNDNFFFIQQVISYVFFFGKTAFLDLVRPNADLQQPTIIRVFFSHPSSSTTTGEELERKLPPIHIVFCALSLSLLFVKEKRCRRWNWGRANNLFSIILLNSPVCLWMWNLKFICLFSPLVLCCSISHFRLCDVSSKWIWEWVELSSHSWSLKLETLLKSARFHPSHIHTHHIPSPAIHSFFHWTITTGQAENHVPIWS